MRISWSGHRRRVALAFLIAGIPCVLLLILASRVVEQERELVRNREHQARIRFASELEQRMLHRLDRVRLAISAGDSASPDPALVAVRRQDTLELPWHVPESYAPWPASDRVRRSIARGEREELSEASPAAAVPHYRQAIDASSDPAESAYSQLLLARALARAGHEGDALELYRNIAEGEPSVRDDQQIPIALYAMERLTSLGEQELEELIEPHLRPDVELPPTALHLLSDLAENIGSAELQEKITSRLRRISHGEQLRRDANAILSQRRQERSNAGWIPYGNWLWLVGSVETAGTEMVIAIRAEDLVSSMIEEDPSLRGLELTHGWNEPGVVAIAAFPGLGLRLPDLPSQIDEAATSRRVFFLASLGFVLLMSLTAATMLLRDVRREVQTAELRSQFVSSVSHELKTPLSAIRMYAESLQIGRPSASMKREEYLDTIVNESERLSRLLDNVLEFSKIERGERRYRLEPKDLGDVVRRSLRGVAYPLQQKGFELALYIEEGLPPVRVDEDAVEQALLNLLTNAMKYSGGCYDLQVRVEREGASVVLRVIDHGIGVPESEKEQIFEKFYRASNSDGVTGAGLGLPIVAHVARMHGGSLLLDTLPGFGSEFTITFPVEVT